MSEKENILEKERENVLESEKERFVRWLVSERGISKRIAIMYARHIVRMLRKLNTMIPTKQQCEDYRDDMLMAGKKNGYALQVVKSIRHYGRFIGKDLKVKYPKREKQKLPTFLSETELKQMLFARRSIKEKLVIMLSGACGLRPNEVARLKISDVNMDICTMSVPTTKTDSRWEIPVSNDVVGTVKAYIQYERPRNNDYDELLLDQYNEPYNNMNCRGIRQIVKSVGKRAGIEKRVYPTMLRHSYATLLMKNGCPLPYVQRLMRHRNIQSTLIYAHVVEDGLKEIYDRFAPLQLTSPMKDQAPFEPEQRLPSQNRLNREYGQPLSDFDKTKIADHRYGLKNGYS
ncbi:MAG: tyrosine-type recombinase/integrase [Candidatus Thermoplasmatota archaeon]|nr:tyrosine-type recombinase/integrase [Candidatus Thermoplasmatota archaeon]